MATGPTGWTAHKMGSDMEEHRINRIRSWFRSKEPQPFIVFGGVLVLVAFFYTAIVVRVVGESLALLVPAGLVANVFFPVWCFVLVFHLICRDGALRELLGRAVVLRESIRNRIGLN